jgi:hypothetical protein
MTKPGKSATKSKSPPKAGTRARRVPVVLLSGGNPQIAKAAGDAPVQAYIAAMPGWKRDVGRRLGRAATAARMRGYGLAA